MRITKPPNTVHPKFWYGSCLKYESSLHQITPYIGKMKSTMARSLIEAYTRNGDIVLDPFVGSGTVALECLIAGRGIIATDINPYAIVLTKAKLYAPSTLGEAVSKAINYLEQVESCSNTISLTIVPTWVKSFFHPRTLREILALVPLLKNNREYFLLACLLGILHHQRPGFLSFPASHLVPYLRTNKFPREKYPELYGYRPLAPRLIAKIHRVYRRFPQIDPNLLKKCIRRDSEMLKLPKNSIDAVITSPPYMNALDYARDNRLRLWFLGISKFRRYDEKVNTKQKFLKLIECCLSAIRHTLKKRGKCVLVIGEVQRTQHRVNTAELVLDIALNKIGGFKKEDVIEDSIPDIRRARREGKCTKREWIMILQKVA